MYVSRLTFCNGSLVLKFFFEAPGNDFVGDFIVSNNSAIAVSGTNTMGPFGAILMIVPLLMQSCQTSTIFIPISSGQTLSFTGNVTLMAHVNGTLNVNGNINIISGS